MNITEFAVFMFFLVGFAITGIIASNVLQQVATHYEQDNTVHQNAKNLATSIKSWNYSQFDILISLVVIGVCLGLVISSAIVGFHPVFLGVSFLGIAVVFFFSPHLANLYYNFVTVYNIESQFPMTSTIFKNFPMIVLITALMVFVFQMVR